MALPSYASPVQRTYYYAYLFFCAVVFFFLIAPLIAIVPISFSVSPFMVFTEGMLAWPPEPEAWSLRWYKNMIGDFPLLFLAQKNGWLEQLIVCLLE